MVVFRTRSFVTDRPVTSTGTMFGADLHDVDADRGHVVTVLVSPTRSRGVASRRVMTPVRSRVAVRSFVRSRVAQSQIASRNSIHYSNHPEECTHHPEHAIHDSSGAHNADHECGHCASVD